MNRRGRSKSAGKGPKRAERLSTRSRTAASLLRVKGAMAAALRRLLRLAMSSTSSSEKKEKRQQKKNAKNKQKSDLRKDVATQQPFTEYLDASPRAGWRHSAERKLMYRHEHRGSGDSATPPPGARKLLQAKACSTVGLSSQNRVHHDPMKVCPADSVRTPRLQEAAYVPGPDETTTYHFKNRYVEEYPSDNGRELQATRRLSRRLSHSLKDSCEGAVIENPSALEAKSELELVQTMRPSMIQENSSTSEPVIEALSQPLQDLQPPKNGKSSSEETKSSKKGLGTIGSLFKSKKSSGMSDSTIQHGKRVRTRRLMREYQDICKQISDDADPHFSVELVNDNLFEWNIRLFKVDPDSDIYWDMQETQTSHILLNLTFPDNFPFAPPFMRVISPRIEKGFVMEGGAICMELLTPNGWASAYTVEAIVMQFSASLVKGQGRISRRGRGASTAVGGPHLPKEFSKKTAEASFKSLVKTHEKYGWVTPPLADG